MKYLIFGYFQHSRGENFDWYNKNQYFPMRDKLSSGGNWSVYSAELESVGGLKRKRSNWIRKKTRVPKKKKDISEIILFFLNMHIHVIYNWFISFDYKWLFVNLTVTVTIVMYMYYTNSYEWCTMDDTFFSVYYELLFFNFVICHFFSSSYYTIYFFHQWIFISVLLSVHSSIFNSFSELWIY